jgi:hypothetical protein
MHFKAARRSSRLIAPVSKIGGLASFHGKREKRRTKGVIKVLSIFMFETRRKHMQGTSKVGLRKRSSVTPEDKDQIRRTYKNDNFLLHRNFILKNIIHRLELARGVRKLWVTEDILDTLRKLGGEPFSVDERPVAREVSADRQVRQIVETGIVSEVDG